MQYSNPDIFRDCVNAYFDKCDDLNRPYTVSGLCVFLSLSKDQLKRYGQRGPHVETVQSARLIIEEQLEERLLGPGRVTGTIFTLKQFGWSDKQENVLIPPVDKDNKDAYKWTVECVEPAKLKEPEKDDDAGISDTDKTQAPRQEAKAV